MKNKNKKEESGSPLYLYLCRSFGGTLPMEQDPPHQTPMKFLGNAVRLRAWIEIRVPRSLVCFGLVALILVALIATLGTWTGAAGAKPLAGQKQSSPASAMQTQSQSYEGVITDTHCGAKHS